MKNNKRKYTKCGSCYKPLSDESKSIGLCRECAVKEIAKLKKRMVRSLAVSVLLVILIFVIQGYVHAAYYMGDHGEVLVPAFFGTMMFNLKSFNRVFYPTMASGILFVAFCFFAPFTSFVNIEYTTYRHKAEQQLYKTDPFGGMAAAGANKQRTDDAGLFIASLLVSVISGPFFFVQRVYKLWKLSNYVGKTSAGSSKM